MWTGFLAIRGAPINGTSRTPPSQSPSVAPSVVATACAVQECLPAARRLRLTGLRAF